MTNEEFENTAEPWYDELAELHFKPVTPQERLSAIDDILLDMARNAYRGSLAKLSSSDVMPS